jgi:hypothetical protein
MQHYAADGFEGWAVVVDVTNPVRDVFYSNRVNPAEPDDRDVETLENTLYYMLFFCPSIPQTPLL